ncbi:hypothetical protein CQA38_04520 [Campylobacter sp. MIT 12-5580]|nr:hypothetical protein CQA38_04520 [Campylobacter sp. MIT 12-5580]
MKKTLLVAATAATFFTACATTHPVGMAFTNAKLPVEATSSVGASKEGRATCKSVLALVAIDDCSVATAAKNGGITQIQSVDYEVNNILGIYGTYTTIVKGK